MKIKEYMNSNVYCLKPNNTIKDCAKLMHDNHIGCIPVCNDQNNIVGLVTDRDIILRGIACNKDTSETPVSEIMTCNVVYCNEDDDVEEIEEIMSQNQIRRLPIIDKNNKIVGIISLGDLVKNNNINNNVVSDTLENICKDNNKNAE